MARSRIRRVNVKTKKVAAKSSSAASVPTRVAAKKTREYSKKLVSEVFEGKKQFGSVSKYEFTQEIGEGSQGAVFAGHQLSEFGIKKKVVFKVLKDTFDEAALKRLVNEAKILQMLSQGLTVEMLALESMTTGAAKKKTFFLVQEFIEGQSLEKLMETHKKKALIMNPVLVGFTLSRIATALDEAHNLTNEEGKPLNVIHRALSPSNILYNGTSGIVKLSDFGMASLDDEGLSASKLKGKPWYMAPEQFSGQHSSASDMWSLGVIGYEALTGFLPYAIKGATPVEVVEKFRKQAAYELRSPAEVLTSEDETFPLQALSDLIMRCLDMSPEKRPTADEFQHTLASTYLYASGLGPTVQTMAAYLKLIDDMPSDKGVVVSDIQTDEDTEQALCRNMHVKRPINVVQYRTSKAFQKTFLKDAMDKVPNPCLKPQGETKYSG